MWTIVEVIYGFEGILICSDRTQCEVCFETKAFLSLSLISRSPLSCLLHCQPSVKRGWAPRLESVLGVCLWAAKCPSNEDNDGETASLAIFLMTADVFISSVTLRLETGALLPADAVCRPAFFVIFCSSGNLKQWIFAAFISKTQQVFQMKCIEYYRAIRKSE